MNNIKISIITPTYNSGKYIEENIVSVLNQNYKNFEHIIIDNNSTDNTHEVLNKYPHLTKIIENDNGQSDALNKGFNKASGDFYLWLNSDDYLNENSINNFLDTIKHRGKCHCVYGDFIWKEHNSERVIRPLNYYSYLLNVFYGCYIPTSGTYFSSDFFKIVGPLDVNYHYKMDTEIFERCKNKNLIFYKIDSVLTYFRVHDTNKSLINEKTNDKELLNRQNLESIKIKKRAFNIDFMQTVIYKLLWILFRYYYISRKFLMLLKVLK